MTAPTLRQLVAAMNKHALLDPAAGPLIAVRLHVLTRKTLGGCLFSGRIAGRAAAAAIS